MFETYRRARDVLNRVEIQIEDLTARLEVQHAASPFDFDGRPSGDSQTIEEFDEDAEARAARLELSDLCYNRALYEERVRRLRRFYAYFVFGDRHLIQWGNPKNRSRARAIFASMLRVWPEVRAQLEAAHVDTEDVLDALEQWVPQQ